MYREALDVYKKTLPKEHRFNGETFHNLGILYCCTYKFDQALHYFKLAQNIYSKKIPKYHHLFVKLRAEMNYVSARLAG